MKVFVPLSGLVSVNVSMVKLLYLMTQVFVPLSGLVSVNWSPEIWQMNDVWRVFVPLSGLVSVNKLSGKRRKPWAAFSSPYRG